ncbi:hypothetical protein [Streptomyces sp. NPDC060131]
MGRGRGTWGGDLDRRHGFVFDFDFDIGDGDGDGDGDGFVNGDGFGR